MNKHKRNIGGQGIAPSIPVEVTLITAANAG